MKFEWFGFSAIAVLVLMSACDQVVGGDDQSDVAPEESPILEQKCVSTIDYRYTNTVPGYEWESRHCTLTYSYDDHNRVVRIDEVMDVADDYHDESYEMGYTFDYDSSDYDWTDVTVNGEFQLYMGWGRTYDVKVSDGRVTRAWVDYAQDYQVFSYDDAGYLVEVWNTSADYYQKTSLDYTGGLLTGRSTRDSQESVEDENDVYDPDIYYPHRYPNDKTNVDFNMFLLKGDPGLRGDPVSLLVSLRMCGNFGDACVEVGGGGQEPDFLPPATIYVTDPDFSQHHSGTLTMINKGFWNAVYEFDGDGCPVKISYDVVYDVVSFEYDEVADTSESFPYDPDLGEDGDDDKVWYRLIKKNYTETKTGEIRCPAVYTITYKE